VITLKSVSLRRGAKALLDQTTVTLNPGERVGLVGRNGAGKTTLFALLDGSLHEDAGEFSRPAAWRLAQVVQEMPSSSLSATDFVIEGDQALLAAQRKYNWPKARMAMANAWRTPTWPCTTPAHTMHRRVPRR
jgi:ATP-binding cassette subfamily F protein 3